VADEDGQILVLSELFKGNHFGEQALLPDGSGKRKANIRTNGRSTLVRVAKKNYFQLIVNHDDKLMLALQAVGDAQKRIRLSAPLVSLMMGKKTCSVSPSTL
jgi:CRP-like cAMP-binding protein